MFQQFLNSQKNNNLFQQQNMNNMNFNQNMFQQYMNQINMNNQFGNQPNFNFNSNMNMENFNNAFLQYIFQLFSKWMMSQGMNNNISNNFNFNNNNLNINNNNLNKNNNNNIKGGKLLNFIFAASNGTTINLKASSNNSIEDLLKLYAQKAGFSENLLGKDINFLYDAHVMNVHDQTRLDAIFTRDYHTITVIDINNVVGA
jgi:hypothetical protein